MTVDKPADTGDLAGADRRPTRVMLVDDHDMFAESLSVVLDGEPDLQVVGRASTVEHARALVSDLQPDVVLLDHRLPDGLGVDIIGELTARQPGVQVVVLTAAADDATLVKATEAGCAGFLLKTSPLDELLSAVRTAAAGEIMISSELLSRLLSRMHAQHERPPTDLTARERDILLLIGRGLTNAAIAQELFISVNTVRNHVQSLLAKLGAHSKLEALSIAIREGLIEAPGQTRV